MLEHDKLLDQRHDLEKDVGRRKKLEYKPIEKRNFWCPTSLLYLKERSNDSKHRQNLCRKKIALGKSHVNIQSNLTNVSKFLNAFGSLSHR